MAHCQSSSYLSIMNEIHVLVVDHDTNHLITTAQLLELCHYKVSIAELASRAMQMMLSGESKFDFILANLNSPDLHGYKLLQQAVAMETPLIVMSSDENAFFTLKALENGAFLCFKKPATMDMMKDLWLHLVKERIRVASENNRFVTNKDSLNRDSYAAGISEIREGNYFKDDYSMCGKIKRKVCTEWTAELHEKFMAAVKHLGEGRCFPKEILQFMNVPGLTRMQVASHLQKCRNDNWRSTGRISHTDSVDQQRPRQFGSMPKICSKNSTAEADRPAIVTENYSNNAPPSYLQGYESAVGRNMSEEFFNVIGEMDCGVRKDGTVGMNNGVESVYRLNDQLLDTGVLGQWGSETTNSNVGSEHD